MLREALDIMIVLDRTGSMCDVGSSSGPTHCRDEDFAIEGVNRFLAFMDPKLDEVVSRSSRPRSTSRRSATSRRRTRSGSATTPWWT